MNEIVLLDVYGTDSGRRVCRLRCIWNGEVILETEPRSAQEEQRLCRALAAAGSLAEAGRRAELWRARDPGFDALVPEEDLPVRLRRVETGAGE